MDLSIQIVNYRSRKSLQECLFSLYQKIPYEVKTEVVVINNDSDDLQAETQAWKEKLDLRVIELGQNVGFEKAHNIGFRISQGEFILFLNPDAKIISGTIRTLLNIISRKAIIGIIAPLLETSSGKIQANGFGKKKTPFSIVMEKIFPERHKFAASKKKIFRADWVSGAALLIRRDIFQELGGFDENYFMYFEDVDLCLRTKSLGYEVVVHPSARAIHEGGKSFVSFKEKKEYYYNSQSYYLKKHFGVFAAAFARLLRLPYLLKNVWLK